ncbi:helix-turn-helix domain-containing protein [Streptomyces sp. NPDC003280]|uniref:helix-turn-helix domain-containing protein n=1 Tax=Streptomyces sp. NPDC003280 TaxID=3364680 RepID=UPI0036A16C31
MTGDDFPELLGRLKERSGLSYGVLGKRLHTSASTLHRYVNGDAVPTDYAPVERFARVCRATPEELVELHRRWILADARRRQRASGTAAGAGTGAAAEDGTATAGDGAASGTPIGTGAEEPASPVPDDATASPSPTAEAAASGTPGGIRAEGLPSPDQAEAVAPVSPAGAGAPPVAGAGAGGGPRGSGQRPAPAARRRAVVLAGVGVAAALVSAALAANLLSGRDHGLPAGAPSTGAVDRRPAEESPSASKTADAKGGSASPSASRGGSPSASAPASGSAARGGEAGPARGGGSEDGAGAPAVAVNPYKWEDPCSQHYLVDQQPEQVPPPPGEPDARGWVTALGGVAGGEQMLALTVQGTGRATVVLEDLHVRVVEKSAPLAWNDFAMGVGCGGGVGTAAFGVDLDAGRPALSPKAGQRDFPYKVSESDPEVFYVFANARAHNVSWYLELDWSSGDRGGTVRIDDEGRPFRTSGNLGRPAYSHPLGSSEWGPAQPG